MLKNGANRSSQIISHSRLPTLAPAVAPVILIVFAFSLFLPNLSAQDVSAQDVSAYNNNENQTGQNKNNTKMNKLVSFNSTNAATNTSITSSQDRQSIPLQARDKFGIDMLYPSKPGGEEWFMNMADPMSDLRFNPQDRITRNADGSWKIKSDQVRMYVSTSNGYNPNQITSDSGQSRVAARGFMGTPQDWREVEITGYVKLNKFSENDNFVWYTRGGKHTDSDPCQGSSYKGNLFYHGETQFAKEQWHVSYAKSPTTVATNHLDGKWVGFKFAMYNFVSSDDKRAVKLENWIDTNADGKNWQKVYEGADAGKWGRAGTECKVNADQIITWGGPLATFRWDFAPDVDFRDLSVREITGQNGTLQGVSYFTGTSTSSNVPEFGNSAKSKESQSNLIIPIPQEVTRSPARISSNLSNESSATDSNNEADTTGNGHIGGEISHEIRVSSGNMVFVTWVQGDEDNTDIYIKISEDGGITFGSPINLSNNPASLSYNQQVVATENGLFIVWEDDDGNSENSDVFFISSSDGGKSFSGKVNLSNDPSGSGNPVVSVSGNNIYVAWSGTSPDSTDILMAHSTNGGDTFTVPVNLSNDPEISYNPKLYLNGTNLLVEWTDQDDNGATNTKRITLPNPVGADSYQNNNKFTSSLNNATNFNSAEQNYTNLITTEDNNNSTNVNTNKNTDSETANQTSTSSPPITDTSNTNSTITNSNSTISTLPIVNYKRELNNKTILDNINNNEDYTPANPTPYPNEKPTLANIGSDELRTIVAAAEEALKSKETPNWVKQANNTAIPTHVEPYTMQQVVRELANKEQQQQKQLQPEQGQDQLQLQANSESNLETSKDEQKVSAGSIVTQEEIKPLERTIGKSLQDSTLQQHDQQNDGQLAQSEGQVQRQSQVQQRPVEGGNPEAEVMTSDIEQQKPGTAATSIPFSQPSSKEAVNGNQGKINSQEQQRLEQQLEREKTKAQEQIQIQLEKEINEQKRQQLQKIGARQNVQSLISQANNAFAQAEELIKHAKLSNQKAQAAVDMYLTEMKGIIPIPENKGLIYESLPPEIKLLVNEAKITDQKALEAVHNYNELRKAADESVAEFNTRYGN